jgi:outer membrane lipoprotein SlyB
MFLKSIAILTIILITGCAATGENLKGNVYKAGQVNTTQSARGIKILKLMPAQVEVDNSQQKQQAQVAGGVLGALAGGLGGGFGGIGSLGTAGTTVAGGAIGVGAGSMVADKVLVQGVTIAYSENNKMFTSTQVGQLCEYKLGNAVIVSTGNQEIRIQSNSSCPVEK